ncbi:MAG TPA: DUF1223 domain-containing protein [Thermoanaerobaculia bacterium]|nr:DUF1223 domain-containing protein [Thermoanaerobaculia bacterium]
MKTLPSLALVALALIAAPRGEAAGERAAAPVVVELFTSQGCSSCPPADRLLSRLTGDADLAGRVIPLAFHVDYWNYIGWQDPFSSADWSKRQNDYARAWGENRIYTPQLVVNGKTECVGSDERLVRQRIAEALKAAPAGQVGLKVEPAAGGLRVEADARLAGGVGRDLDLLVALYETGLSTPVKAGENARQTLQNDYVVRRLARVLTLPAAAGSAKSGAVSLALDPTWKRGNLGVAAFLQDPVTRMIHGAAVAKVPAK